MRDDEHYHGVTANTIGCFTTFKGCTVKGALAHDGGTILIFDCGYGLQVSHSGAYWIRSKSEIDRIQETLIGRLQAAGAEIKNILEMAGTTP